jgi:hypothetical protein
VPQLIPPGAEVTEPLPEPAPSVTESVYVLSVKLAVTVVAAVIVTVHVPVPLHPPPLQPLKTEPVAGVAVSVTGVPWLTDCAQVAPQLIPVGDDVTVPAPVPLLLTVSV